MAANRNERTIRLSVYERARLNKRIRATGYTAQELITDQHDMPEGFDIETLLSGLKKGRGSLLLNDYEYFLSILDRYEERKSTKGHVSVTQKLTNRINKEIQRTGVTPAELISRMHKQNREAGITDATIYNWLNGKVRKANKYAVQRTLKLYAEIPDKSKL